MFQRVLRVVHVTCVFDSETQTKNSLGFFWELKFYLTTCMNRNKIANQCLYETKSAYIVEWSGTSANFQVTGGLAEIPPLNFRIRLICSLLLWLCPATVLKVQARLPGSWLPKLCEKSRGFSQAHTFIKNRGGWLEKGKKEQSKQAAFLNIRWSKQKYWVGFL